MPISPNLVNATTKALRDAAVGPEDAAGVALVKRYAALIEKAEEVAEALDDIEPEDEDQAATIKRLRARVDAQAVASDLGPKMLQALAALGMTPAARAAATKGGNSGGNSSQGDALARLRAERTIHSA